MKTIFSKTATTIIIALSISACQKEVAHPSYGYNGTPAPVEVSVVKGSDWFQVNWSSSFRNGVQAATSNTTVLEMSDNILRNGKVIVFGKGGNEMRKAIALPTIFDHTAVGVEKAAGNLKFTAINLGAGKICSSIQFRYILIPPTRLAATDLDYSNYEAVCSYYKLPL